MKVAVKKGQRFADVPYRIGHEVILFTTERDVELSKDQEKAIGPDVKADTRLIVNGKPVVAKVAESK